MLVHVVRDCPLPRFARLGQTLLAAADRAGDGATDTEPRLAIVELTGDDVVLGRFQRAASALHVARAAHPPLRRSGGGRALAAGAGTVGVLLAMPANAAVTADKVLNRYLRGLIKGLGAAYFGRDFLSAGGRQLAIVSQDGTAGGAALVEAVIGVARTLELPAGLHAYPPHPDPRAAGKPSVTLAELTGRLPSFDEVVERVVAGHVRAYGGEVERRDLDLELLPATVEPDEADLRRGGPLPIPIGFVEALVAVEHAQITRARLHGDFIAPAYSVAGLERALRGCPLLAGEIGARVNAAFRPPSTIIGVTALSTLADAILAAAS